MQSSRARPQRGGGRSGFGGNRGGRGSNRGGFGVTGEDVKRQGVRSVVQVVEADEEVAQAVVDLSARSVLARVVGPCYQPCRTLLYLLISFRSFGKIASAPEGAQGAILDVKVAYHSI
jgi:hypothetical protein